MRVLKPFSYSGRRYRAGEELEMRDMFAATMQRLGKAERAPTPKASEPEKASARSYRRRDMVAEQPVPPPPPAPPEPSEPAPPTSEAMAATEAMDLPKFRSSDQD
jgi:hypothetical protein